MQTRHAWLLTLLLLTACELIPGFKKAQPPGAPTEVTAVTESWYAPSSDTALVSWKAPEDSGSSPIRGFLVTASPGEHTATTEGETTVRMSGLLPGATYTFTVSASNDAGRGPESEPSAPFQLPGLPKAPTDITASVGDGHAIVHWASGGNEGASFCNYRAALTCPKSFTVTAYPGGATVTIEQPLSVDSWSHTRRSGNHHAILTGLTNGTAYTFTVQETSWVGTGPESNPTGPLTPECSIFAQQVLVPLTPRPVGAYGPAGSVTTGQLNADALPDVVVVGPASVDVLFNQGGGELSSPLSLTQEPGPVTLADFNGDARVDIAVRRDTQVRLFLNEGNGTFTAPTSIETGGIDTPIRSLHAVDLNGDGRVDLVLTGASTVGVLRNAGHGSFEAPSTYGAYPGLSALETAELNGDGKVDLVLLQESSVRVLLNSGDGTFPVSSTHAVGATPSALALGDLDGNGSVDLVTAGAQRMTVFLNDGSGTFGAGTSSSVRTGEKLALRLTDMTGDDRLDVVVSYDGSFGTPLLLLSLLTNQGDGTFGPEQKVYTSWRELPAGAFTLGDVNHDGAPDLAITLYGLFSSQYSLTGNLAAILYNDGHGNFGAPVPFPTEPGPSAPTLVDLDGEGALDLLVTYLPSEKLSVLRACPRSAAHDGK